MDMPNSSQILIQVTCKVTTRDERVQIPLCSQTYHQCLMSDKKISGNVPKFVKYSHLQLILEFIGNFEFYTTIAITKTKPTNR